MMDLRLRAYLPNGASQGLLPAPDGFSAAVPLNDIPSLALDYGVKGPRSELLGQPLELALEVSGDGGATWAEPDDARFLYLRDARDPLRTADTWKAEAPGYIWRLQKARVLDEGQAVEGKRSFVSKTVGFILVTLWQEAQARGALAGMTLQGNATQDASGASWAAAQTISRDYDLGTDYLQVLQDMADLGLLDYRMSGRTLKVYLPETALATDRTVGANQVQLTPVQLTEAPFRRTWEGLADHLTVMGDEDATVSLTNAGALKPWGRWEDFISQGGVSDTGTLTALGQRYQTTTAGPRAEYTQAVALGGDGPRPLLDFKAGDYVWSRVLDGTRTRYRVRQITLQKEGSSVQGNVVLNDRFLEADIRARRAITALTGGASLSGSTGGPPAPTLPGPDILQPATVAAAPGLTSADYLDEAGATQSQITVDWPDVSTNADGTPISDLAGYYVQQKKGAANSTDIWRDVTRVDGGTSMVTLSPYPPGSTWSFRVRAYDTVGNLSPDWSAVGTVTTAEDVTGPVQPSAPALTSRLAVISCTWDGSSASGGAMDADFSHVEVHVSSVSNFAPTKGDPATLLDRLTGAGTVVKTDAAYATTYFFRLLPVDKSGNAGTVSDQEEVTVQPLVNADLIGRVVDGVNLALESVRDEHVAPRSIYANKLSISDFTNYLDNPGFETGAVEPHYVMPGGHYNSHSILTTVPDEGTYALQLNTNAVTSATTIIQMNGWNGDLFKHARTRVGEVWRGLVRARRGNGTGEAQVTLTWFAKDGAYVSFNQGPWVTLTASYQDLLVEAVAPATAAYVVLAVRVNNASGSARGGVDFIMDNARLSKKYGGELIVEGGIKTANLEALAVTAAKLAALAVETDKLAANAVTAEKIDSGQVTTRHLVVGGDNRVNDPGLESDDVFTIHYALNNSTLARGFSTTVKRSGSRSMTWTVETAFTAGTQVAVFDGVITDPTYHPRILPGETWRAGFWVRANSGNTIRARAGAITRKLSDPGTNYVNTYGAYTALTTAWQFISADVTYPSDAGGAGYLGLQLAVDNGTVGDVVYVDDVEKRKIYGGDDITTISAGKLSTGVLQAGTSIIAGTPGAARVEMTASGLTAYAADGVTQTFDVDAATGDVIQVGTLKTGPGAAHVRVSQISGMGRIDFFSGDPDELSPASIVNEVTSTALGLTIEAPDGGQGQPRLTMYSIGGPDGSNRSGVSFSGVEQYFFYGGLSTGPGGAFAEAANYLQILPGQNWVSGDSYDGIWIRSAKTGESLATKAVKLDASRLDLVGDIYLAGSSGIDFGHGGNKLQRMNFGVYQVSLNASGRGTIPHGLGVTPSFATVITDGEAANWYIVVSRGASTITVECRNSTGGLVVSTSRSVAWMAAQ